MKQKTLYTNNLAWCYAFRLLEIDISLIVLDSQIVFHFK